MSDNVIEVQGLTKRYGETTVVNSVSSSVARGEIFGLLGPNGAGKTTTILMLLGLTKITKGQARVGGYGPVREPLVVKRRVGYLPDQVGFYDHLTAVDNMRYIARLIGLSGREGRLIDATLRGPEGDGFAATGATHHPCGTGGTEARGICWLIPLELLPGGQLRLGRVVSSALLSVDGVDIQLERLENRRGKLRPLFIVTLSTGRYGFGQCV
jgi:hypothetical protein